MSNDQHELEVSNAYDSEKEDAKKLFFAKEKQEKEKASSNQKFASMEETSPKVNIERIINKTNNSFLEDERRLFLLADKEFLILLRNFINNQEKKEVQKRKLKKWFFWIVMLGFLILLIAPIILIFKANELSQITVIISLVSLLIELVTAIIVLPQIIAKYLFNKKEDEQLLHIIDGMQKYNQNKHDLIKE